MGLGVMVIALQACFMSTLVLAEITNVGAEVVKVSTTPIFRKIPQGKMNKEFQVVVRVEAPVASEKGFAPIDLVVVLDPTSSMALAPVEKKASRLEVLRTAMKFVVRELGENDRLAVVSSNDCSVDEEHNTGFLDISGDGRRNAIERLDRLEARGGGGGAFLLGLETAVKMLDGRAAGSRNRAGFIIVLSDGGEDSSRINVHGSLRRYPVHAVGLSAAHDARALSSIAQESHGTYSFVDEMNLESIAGALAVCIGGLKTVVAVDMRVTLAAADERGRVQIKRIDSGGYESHISEHKASGSIAVGVLYANEVKNFVVHLRVPAAGTCDHHHLLTVGHSYSHAPGLPAAEGHHRVLVQRLGVDDDAQQVPSALVLQQMVQFELLDMVATEVADYSLEGSVLQSRWDEFRRAHQFWAGVELGCMEKEVDALVSSLEGSSGVAYVLSWVSSHRMQRATSMGSPENVAAELLTPAMKLMLEEAHRLPATVDSPAGHEDRGCLDFLTIDRRLRVWSKARHDLQQLMFETSSEADLTAVFQEASLGAIDRAAHHDIYLAVVHATSQKRCRYAQA